MRLFSLGDEGIRDKVKSKTMDLPTFMEDKSFCFHFLCVLTSDIQGKGKKAPLRKTMMEMMVLGKTVVKVDMMVKMMVVVKMVIQEMGAMSDFSWGVWTNICSPKIRY